MATGMVTTARGLILNLDELIAKGSQPIGKPEKSTRTSAGYNPATNTKPQVRGFVPTGGAALPPDMENDEAVVDTDMKSSFANNGKAVTLNDLTGVKVTKSTRKIKTEANKPVGSAKDDAELGELLGKLKKSKK